MSDRRQDPAVSLPPDDVGSDAVGPDAVEPAEALAGVWDLLDALPRAAAGPSMTATTIEMVAVDVERAAGAAAAGTSRVDAGPLGTGPQGGASAWRSVVAPRRMIGAAAVVIGALLAGVVAGRATALNSDHRILEYLPIVRNVDLLREAGSVEFLEAVAARRFPPPRRQAFPRSAADARRVEMVLGSLRPFRAGTEVDRETLDRRRAEVAAMTGPERRDLERSVDTFARLSGGERRDLVDVAEALGDPRHGELLDAARLWHQWIASCDPADRQDIIDLDTRGRLEWLVRQTRIDRRPGDRPDGRMDGRPPRGWDRERPPPPEWDRDRDDRPWPPPGPPHFGPPPFGPPGPEGFEGPPRPRRPPQRGRPADGPRDATGDAAGNAADADATGERSPAETPAPPR
jgi:hypothetical protein